MGQPCHASAQRRVWQGERVPPMVSPRRLTQAHPGLRLMRITADLSALSVDVMVSAFKSYSALLGKYRIT